MAKACLSLGGNTGDRAAYLRQAMDQIKLRTGPLVSCSSVYETEPWGYEDPSPYYNQVIIVDTRLEPQALLKTIREIETELGRRRNISGYEPRTIDIDILLYEDLILKESGLEIPHPRMHLRNFILVPLTEIDAEMIHPSLKKTAGELLSACPDTLSVRKIENKTETKKPG
ncbi:MAG: 2-amino-4-hydroxy-6-hydroxymethyldihydropteridine diphosphokinase [Bacteroidales bacterium]|nr:2-amino-4-hydroxy-6-hydroxymethyldihydropteridine diphosphokinase [Bacteroidales bacterium]